MGSCVGQGRWRGPAAMPHARRGTALAPLPAGTLRGTLCRTLATRQGTCPGSRRLVWWAPWGRRTRAVPGWPPTGPPLRVEVAEECGCQAGWPGLPPAGRLHPGAPPAAHSRQPRWGCAGARPGSGAPQSRLCAGRCRHTHVRVLGSSWWERDPLPSATPGRRHPLPTSTGTPEALARRPLPLARGHPLAFPGLRMRDARARLGHTLPPCPHAPPAAAMLHPRAGIPGTLPPCQASCQGTTLVPAQAAKTPLQPLSPSRRHPVPQFLPLRGLRPGGFPVSPSFPRERGGSFPCRFPASRSRARRL